MIKTALCEFDEPTARLVPLSRRGLRGHDRSQFLKRAGHDFLGALDRLRPGEVPVHCLAVGASDFYGDNRNGDAFRAAVCRDRHETFQKYAHYFHDHCFPAGTPIVRADRTRAEIETLAVGDLVATQAGPRPILQVMRRPYKGPGVSLRFRGEPDRMTATVGHPVLAVRRSDFYCRHGYSVLSDSKHKPKCCELRAMSAPVPEYLPIEEIQPGDFLVVPRPTHGHRTVDPDFAALVGWVAAEGNLGARGLIQFCFSETNTDDIFAVSECLAANGLHVTTTPRPQYGVVMLSAGSVAVHAALSLYIAGVLSKKRLTNEVLTWDAESLYRMLGTYIDGDGHVPKEKIHAGQLRIRSSSPQMRRILADVIRSLGIPATIQEDCEPREMRSPTNGQIYWGNGSGVVTVNSAYSAELCRYSRKQFTFARHNTPTVRMLDGQFLLQVTERDDIELDEDVFNLEVEDQHHYLACEAVAHNCNKDPRKNYGRIIKSAFNEPMKRIELLVALSGTPEAAARNGGFVATRDLEKLARGEDLCQSMACKVSHDLCRGCNNRARNRSEYCDTRPVKVAGRVIPACSRFGCAHGLTRVDHDGFVQGVDNPDPLWFDFSGVHRNADRIAVAAGLLKSAGHGPGPGGVVPSAEAAARLGLIAPPRLLGAELPLPAAARSACKLAALLAEREPDAAVPSAWDLAFHPAVRGPAPGKAAAAPDLPPAVLFRALADARVLLPVADWLDLVAGKAAAAAAAGEVAAQLPGIFGRLAADPETPGLLGAANPYRAAAATASAAARTWAHQKTASHSLEAEWASSRAQRAALRGAEPAAPAALSAEAAELAAAQAGAEKLARQYALYQLAFLEALPDDRSRAAAADLVLRANRHAG